MKKMVLALFFVMAFASQAFAFNPDPLKYEFLGQNDKGHGIFYELATAKADGLKADVVVVQVDPKNRTLRHYNIIIDPNTKQLYGSMCRIYDYKGNLLDRFNLPSKGISYKDGDFYSKIYQDMVDRGIIHLPPPVVYVPYIPPKTEWEISVTGGEEIVVELDDADDGIIVESES